MITGQLNQTVSVVIEAEGAHQYGHVHYQAPRGQSSAVTVLVDLLTRTPSLYYGTINPHYTTMADLDTACRNLGMEPVFSESGRPYSFPKGAIP